MLVWLWNDIRWHQFKLVLERQANLQQQQQEHKKKVWNVTTNEQWKYDASKRAAQSIIILAVFTIFISFQLFSFFFSSPL